MDVLYRIPDGPTVIVPWVTMVRVRSRDAHPRRTAAGGMFSAPSEPWRVLVQVLLPMSADWVTVWERWEDGAGPWGDGGPVPDDVVVEAERVRSEIEAAVDAYHRQP
jgi:hypothetical protein